MDTKKKLTILKQKCKENQDVIAVALLTVTTVTATTLFLNAQRKLEDLEGGWKCELNDTQREIAAKPGSVFRLMLKNGRPFVKFGFTEED